MKALGLKSSGAIESAQPQIVPTGPESLSAIPAPGTVDLSKSVGFQQLGMSAGKVITPTEREIEKRKLLDKFREQDITSITNGAKDLQNRGLDPQRALELSTFFHMGAAPNLRDENFQSVLTKKMLDDYEKTGNPNHSPEAITRLFHPTPPDRTAEMLAAERRGAVHGSNLFYEAEQELNTKRKAAFDAYNASIPSNTPANSKLRKAGEFSPANPIDVINLARQKAQDIANDDVRGEALIYLETKMTNHLKALGETPKGSLDRMITNQPIPQPLPQAPVKQTAKPLSTNETEINPQQTGRTSPTLPSKYDLTRPPDEWNKGLNDAARMFRWISLSDNQKREIIDTFSGKSEIRKAIKANTAVPDLPRSRGIQ